MAKNKQPEKRSNKNNQNTSAEQQVSNESHIQEQLAHYPDIAQQLYQSSTYSQAEEAIAPINEMSEEDQITFLRALSRERNVDAASVLLAVNTLTPHKEVRKEARRSLIRLESLNVYSQWTPPAAPALIDAFNLISPSNDSLPVDTIVDEDVEDEDDEDDDEDFEEEDEDESEAVIEDFITAWAEQEYEDAYDLLASDSPLRGGLEQEAWVALRNEWAEQAEPESVKVEVGYRYETEEELENAPETDDDTTQELDAFWSLVYQETPLDSSLPELPKPTIAYPLTGRHWFWSAYTLVEEDGEWYIHSMIDKGAEAQQLSDDVLNQRVEEIADELKEMPIFELFTALEGTEDEDEEDEEDEEDVEDELPDTEDEEDEEDELDFANMLSNPSSIMEQFEESYWFTVQASHYGDALIAHNPQEVSYYTRAMSQAQAAQDLERFSAYAALIAERIPEERALALRLQAMTSLKILTEELADLEEEPGLRLLAQTEKVLRESLTLNKEDSDYMLLAQLLSQQEEHLDEAEQLYQQALAVATDSEIRGTIESGLADIAHAHEKPEEALIHLQRASELAPNLEGVWYKLGDTYQDLGQTKRAEESFIRSTELDPENEDGYAALATLWNEQGKKKEAMRILEKGLDANPESATLRGLMAIQYIDQRNYRKADQLLEEAEELDPDAEIIQLARQILATIQAQQAQQAQSRQGKPKSNKRKRR